MDEKSVTRAFETINDMLIDRGTIEKEHRKTLIEEDIKNKMIFAEKIGVNETTIHVVFYLHNKFTTNTFNLFGQKFLPENKDHMIFVYKDKFTTVNEKYLKSQLGFKKIELFCIKNLLFNITKHELVPKHELMKNDDAKMIYDRYSIKDNQKIVKLPLLITKTDPVSKYYDFKPGNLIKITRPSSSVGESVSYRYCV